MVDVPTSVPRPLATISTGRTFYPSHSEFLKVVLHSQVCSTGPLLHSQVHSTGILGCVAQEPSGVWWRCTQAQEQGDEAGQADHGACGAASRGIPLHRLLQQQGGEAGTLQGVEVTGL